MSIARFEPISINSLTRGVDATGAPTTTSTLWMNTAARVFDVEKTLELKDGFRLYTDQTNFQINFSPNSYAVANNQDNYEVVWRGSTWRITDVQEDNNRQYLKLICNRVQPSIQV